MNDLMTLDEVANMWHCTRRRARDVITKLEGFPPIAPGETDAERAAWLGDKIAALGDYAREASAMLQRWPDHPAAARDPVTLSDEQVEAALQTWFCDDGNGTFESRMRRAIEAAAAKAS